MKLYLARWPDGTAVLLSARSLEDVAEQLDEISDPGACEVVPYRGPVFVGLRPATRSPWAGVEVDPDEDLADPSASAIVEAIYPVLHKALANEERELTANEWPDIVANEKARILEPSRDWVEAMQNWWEAQTGQPADRTAALRQIAGVSIPGEPKPTTPEQQALFEAEQRRMMDRVAAVLQPPPKAPKKKTPPKPRRRPKKPRRPR